MLRRSLLPLLIFLLLSAAAEMPHAGEDFGGGGFSGGPSVDRQRLARTIYRHTFENIRDPDTGVLLPESAALGPDGWPDFWEPVRAVGFPEYLIPSVRVVPDPEPGGRIPGAYRDEPNHVLLMEFDGTRVGIRTRQPVPVDPSLAYEYSIMVRDSGLDGARIRTGVEWMRIDQAASAVLRTDETDGLRPGHADWPVQPARMLVNDPPPEANAARLFVILDREPGRAGGAYHGRIWLDEIILRPLPKILIDPPRAVPGGGQVIPVRYAGLFDNVPDPVNPGFFKGKRYTRRVEVTDVFNHPVGVDSRERIPIPAGDDGSAVEEVSFPQERYGVYYFNIRLYDAEDRLATDVMRAVAVMRPARVSDGIALRTGRPLYGASAGIIPDSIIASPGFLREALTRAGIRMTKVVPWRAGYSRSGENDAYYLRLADEMRNLRASGIGAAGVLQPPEAMFGSLRLAEAMNESPERLSTLISEAGRHLGLFMDGWQWGGDGDGSLRGVTDRRNLDLLSATLAEYARGIPTIYGLRLDAEAGDRFPRRPDITEAFFPNAVSLDRLWPEAARVFPWLFEQYYRERGDTYPPRRLSALAPAPPADAIEEQARILGRGATWISLENAPAYQHEPNSAAEKVQLEQFLIRTVYASIPAPDAVYLGDLFHPSRGMLRPDFTGEGTLETMARPIYLAAGTAANLLEGTEYLGQIGLLPPYEAHVFRRPGTDESVIALWHNDSAEEHPLRRIEIAAGPPLQLVDWAGNAEPLPDRIPVRRVPSFITGLSANLALTRMSVRVAPVPPVLSANRRQNQTMEVVNHLPRQAPMLFRLRYAARPDGGMENGWSVNPEEMRINLAPWSPSSLPGRLRYSVSPDPNSQIQQAGPGFTDKSGAKIAQVNMSVNTSPPADMLLYLPYNLRSEIDVDVEKLARADDPHFVTLQLKIRWFPELSARRRGEIKVLPYYIKKGQMKESSAFPISVKALSPEERGNPDAMFESVELRIPISPQVQTWVGLTEDGGSGFYVCDITDFLLAP